MKFKSISELEKEINEADSCDEMDCSHYIADKRKDIEILEGVLKLIDKISVDMGHDVVVKASELIKENQRRKRMKPERPKNWTKQRRKHGCDGCHCNTPTERFYGYCGNDLWICSLCFKELIENGIESQKIKGEKE